MPESPRLSFDIQGGLNTVDPPDLIKPGSYAFLQNVRKLLDGRMTARPPLGANQLGSALPAGITSLTRMNDPYLPGYVLVIGAAGIMYVNATQIATGFSGNPLSFLPYDPPQSPRPFCYIADPSMAVTIPSYSGYTGPVTGMVKVRSDGTCYKTGIMEPQAAPGVSVSSGSGPNWVSYRYTYWSDEGAESNPSPESAPQTLPQTSLAATLQAASGGVINPNITVNATQYQGNGTQIRTASVAPGTITDYIIAKDFGITVPSGVTIDGVQAATQWLGQFAGTGIISAVALFYQGNIIGQIKAPGIQNQQSPTTAIQGGNADSWGTVLTPAIVNDTTFGIGFQITTAESGGSDRSFFNNFTLTVYYTTLSATATATSSTDPQVKSINFYRQTPGLDNFTFVGRVPNSAPSFTDTLTDLQIAANPQLSFANFEPFPSIDLPRKGTLTVGANGACTWVSGDTFNVRWLPGTDILIDNGTGSQVAYLLYNRPTSTTAMKVWSTAIDPTTGFLTISFPPTGTNLAWEITAPTLAAQPSPVIWGPTPDNAGSFYFGLDPNNPGDIVWSLGNNFDSAPDTNRQFVTSANEALQNGTVTSELSTVFSTERFWLIYPNFSDAVATVTGTQGQQWILVQSAATRGLYMRYALGALGSMIGFRAKDGIFVSQGGGPEKDISANIYNLFPHGGQAPAPVTIAGHTVFPPDDTKVKAQTITLTPGYIFYNYQDVNGNPRTLCYDEAAKGWTVDAYTPNVNCHSWAIGVVNQILVGCTDGTARAFDSTASEAQTAIMATPSQNGGDSRALKALGDLFMRAVVSSSVAIALYQTRGTVAMTGFAPTSLTGSGASLPYIINFTSGFGDNVDDVMLIASWGVGSGDILELWEVEWYELPDIIQDQPTDWMDLGSPGANYVRGLVLEANTFNVAKIIGVEDEFGTLHTPQASPITLNGQRKIGLSFRPPFVSHIGRIVSSDGVPWQRAPQAGWSLQWISDPYPELTTAYTPIMEIHGPDNKFVQGIKLIADTANQSVAFQVLFDGGQTGPTFTGTFNGKQTLVFSWTPFQAHDLQLVPQANARIWTDTSEWVFKPFAESQALWQTEMISNGLPGWQHIPWLRFAYQSTSAVTLTLTTDQGAIATITIPSSGGVPAKFFAWVPSISGGLSMKFKMLSWKATSTAPFNVFEPDIEVAIKPWGANTGYQTIKPLGGPTAGGAEV